MRPSRHDLYVTVLAFNPFSPLVLSRKVDILPHQLGALYGDYSGDHSCPSPLPHRVSGLLRAGFPVNALIADETGLGKTVVLGLFILSLMLRDLARDIIILVPKAIVWQWQDELLYKFGVYFRVIERGNEFLDLVDNLKYGRDLRVIASVDLIKGRYGHEFVSSLPPRALDLVVIDEAHHVISPRQTLRSEIALKLVEKTKSLVLSSATPFRGYYDAEYRRVLDLLGEDFIYVRRFKDQVRGVDGRPVFPRRASYTVEISPDPQWYQLYIKLVDFLKLSTIPEVVKLVLLKRMASSLHALHATLRKLQAIALEDPFSEETDDIAGIEPDARGQKLGGQYYSSLHIVLDIVGAYVGRGGLTVKERELLRQLDRLTKEGKVVVFTEYRTTLERLMEVLEKAGIGFAYIHGGMGLSERRSAITTFWNDTKTRVLLATDAAGEGINLQVAAYQVNYDIPWSPAKLEQRFGRIHRYGQRGATYVYNLAVKGTIDGHVINKVLKKLNDIAKLLGDWVFDYIGTVVKAEEVRRAVLEGVEVIKRETLLRRFEQLRKDTHDPKCDLAYVYSQIEGLKGYMSKYINGDGAGHVDVLEVLRVSPLTLLDLKNRAHRVGDATDVVVAVCRARDKIASASLLERRGSKLLDPLNGVEVDYGEAESYLVREVKSIARFYGFEECSEELYYMV